MLNIYIKRFIKNIHLVRLVVEYFIQPDLVLEKLIGKNLTPIKPT